MTFRNQYDSDCSTWSPQGRIHQLEYALEAVKQGSACVGLKSKTHAIVLALKRSSSELGSYQKKIFKIDDHIGIAISGLTADARLLSKYMRNECINHKFAFERPMQTVRLVTQVADKAQVHTQQYGRRPYGVGLLVIGFDQTGPHLYESFPTGNFYDYKAMAIGARSQSARTYLEKYFPEFENLSLQELIKHGLQALRETTQTSTEGLNIKNVSIGIVGVDHPYELIEGAKLQLHLDTMDPVASTPVPSATATVEETKMEI